MGLVSEVQVSSLTLCSCQYSILFFVVITTPLTHTYTDVFYKEPNERAEITKDRVRQKIKHFKQVAKKKNHFPKKKEKV